MTVNHFCVWLQLLQVKPTLQNFFSNVKLELYLLQIDAKKVKENIYMFFDKEPFRSHSCLC